MAYTILSLYESDTRFCGPEGVLFLLNFKKIMFIEIQKGGFPKDDQQSKAGHVKCGVSMTVLLVLRSSIPGRRRWVNILRRFQETVVLSKRRETPSDTASHLRRPDGNIWVQCFRSAGKSGGAP